MNEVVVDRITISDKECKQLERAWFELQALRNVASNAKAMGLTIREECFRGAVEVIVNSWKEAQENLDRIWVAIRTGYFRDTYESEEYSCQCDFKTHVVTITKQGVNEVAS